MRDWSWSLTGVHTIRTYRRRAKQRRLRVNGLNDLVGAVMAPMYSQPCSADFPACLCNDCRSGHAPEADCRVRAALTATVSVIP